MNVKVYYADKYSGDDGGSMYMLDRYGTGRVMFVPSGEVEGSQVRFGTVLIPKE